MKYDDHKAIATTFLGYAQNRDKISFFEGSLKGTVVSPRGNHNFGFDPIFQPEGHEQTQAEMTAEQKNQISQRRKALEELKKALS
jgi:inosine triphosphate pyrophosphatase